MNLESRIERIEQRHGITTGDGCAVCAFPGEYVTRIIKPSPDGAPMTSDEPPPPCAACGKPRDWLTVVIHDAETYAAQREREAML